MKKYILKILFFIFLCLTNHVQLAQTKTDSLKTALLSAKNDTVRLNIYYDLIEESTVDSIRKNYNKALFNLSNKLILDSDKDISLKAKKSLSAANMNMGVMHADAGNMPEALKYYSKALTLAEEAEDKKSVANVLNNIGYVYDITGETNKAIDYYSKSLKIQEEINDKIGEASSLNNLGVIFANQGSIIKALDYYRKSLKIKEQLGYKFGIAKALINIGFIYDGQGNYKVAIVYYQKSIKLLIEMNNKIDLAAAYNNLGSTYKGMGNQLLALTYYQRSLAIYLDLKNKRGIARAYHNLASIYSGNNDNSKALNYLFKSLQIQKEVGEKRAMTYAFLNIGQIYFKQKKYKLAFAYSDSASHLTEQLGYADLKQRSENLLTKIDSANGNYKGAFEHFKKAVIYRDSLNNESTRKASIKSQLTYDYDKKEAVIKEQQEKERAISREKDRFQQIVIWSVVLGLFLVIIFAAFIFRSLKTTKKQKLIIEEKQREILDSIRYAKRIQISLMPSEKYISKHLNRK